LDFTCSQSDAGLLYLVRREGWGLCSILDVQTPRATAVARARSNRWRSESGRGPSALAERCRSDRVCSDREVGPWQRASTSSERQKKQLAAFPWLTDDDATSEDGPDGASAGHAVADVEAV